MDSSTSSDSFDRDGGETKERVPDTLDKESDSREEKENWNNCESPEQEALVTELNKIESEMRALREVLARKQRRANEIRSILGNPIVNDVKEKLKSLQDSEALQKTNQAFKSAGEKTSAAFSNIGKRFVDVRTKIGVSIGSSLNNVKKSKSLFTLPSERGNVEDEGTDEQWEQI
ncbi:tumor protein D53 homolog isoform X2 [Watersipora subatra]|uniref:tumor protein D53 homolog isoform X2 n=1 Tax=Watersipora subatra TaxID=2589382 RepID=UPI00355B2940